MARSVAVIGGGAAGLAVLRHTINRPNIFNRVVAYELTGNVGGTWVYTDKVGKNEHGHPIMSSMYRNLRTNLPKEVMAFPGYPFPKDWPSFMTHKQVLSYLSDFADHYSMKDFIEFNTVVENVHPVKTDGKTKWQVDVRNVFHEGNQVKREEFDAVFVCSGHYSLPRIPDIPGQDMFQGEIIHSHNYRCPEPFADKTILFLGAGPSGTDIALDIAPVAKKVIISHNKPSLESPLPANVDQKPGIKSFTQTGVVLLNNEEVDLDAVMFCTGYSYSYPFLTRECNVNISDGRVLPLYKHLVHTEHNSLFFIGILHTICPFPNFDMQVRFGVSTLDGSHTLPTKTEMDEDILKDFRWRLSELGWPSRYAHKMGALQWTYMDDLADIANLTKIPRCVELLYNYVHDIRRTELCEYKEHEYQLIDDDNFKVVKQ